MCCSCNLLRVNPFSSCNDYIDPTPYINACSDTLCKYPSVDELSCQFLWAYAKACSLQSNITLEGWWSEAGCCKIINFTATSFQLACFQNNVSLSFFAAEPQAYCQEKQCRDHEFCGSKHSGKKGCLCRALFVSKYKQSGSLGRTSLGDTHD